MAIAAVVVSSLELSSAPEVVSALIDERAEVARQAVRRLIEWRLGILLPEAKP